MSICKLLNIQYPILQGAMAQISTHPLVSAVSNAGGLGIIASGGMTAKQLREEIAQCYALTTKPFAVNLMLKMPNISELIDEVIQGEVKIVTTGAGTPKLYMDKLKSAGIIIIPVVPSVAVAQKMEQLGVDAIICEGEESGGHIGTTTTMSLIPQVTQSIKIPVIAAGGIADGRGIAAAYALGAQGVQAGTMFLVATECPIPDHVKQFIINTTDTSTTVTGRKNGMPVRSIKNKMIETYQRLENENITASELEKLTIGSARKAVMGDVENGSVMAGQICGLLKQVKPAKQIIEEAFTQADEIATLLSNKIKQSYYQ